MRPLGEVFDAIDSTLATPYNPGQGTAYAASIAGGGGGADWQNGSGCRRPLADQTPPRILGAAQFKLAETAKLSLLQRRLRLDPCKHLSDSAVGVDRLDAALMAGCASING